MSTPLTEVTPEAVPTLANSAAGGVASKRWQRTAPAFAGHTVFDDLVWRVQARRQNGTSLAVGVSSPLPRVGTTTVAANLALRAAELQSDRVLLVDARGNSGGLLKLFRVAPAPGLAEILSGKLAVGEIEPISLRENLDLISAGAECVTGSLRIHHHLVKEVLESLKRKYSLIVVDLPPADQLGSTIPLARNLCGVVLVVGSESSRPVEVQRAAQQLEQDGIAVWGTVLNRYRRYIPRWLERWV